MFRIVICGIRIRIDFSFLVFLSLILLLRDSDVILSFFTVCMIHETGHAIALCLSGGKISSVIFYGMGIRILPCRCGLFPLKKELFILLSGPALNLLLFLIFKSSPRLCNFALLNLCTAVFNLLPYSSLDGGAALKLLSDNLVCGQFLRCVLIAIQAALPLYLVFCVINDMSLFPLLCITVFYFVSEIKGFR